MFKFLYLAISIKKAKYTKNGHTSSVSRDWNVVGFAHS